MNTIKIGINPLTWTNDDLPNLGGETSLNECLTEGKKAGFAGFELGQKFPRDADVLTPILNAHDLQLVSGWFSGEIYTLSVDEEIQRLQAHIDLLKLMGCSVVVYCDTSGTIQGQMMTGLSKRPCLQDEEWDVYSHKLSQLAAYVESCGLMLAYHHHMGTILQTEAEIDRLMQLTSESVYLLLDTGHLFYAGGDPVAVASRYGNRIAHVHCKDIRLEVMRHTLNRDRSFLQGVLDGVFAMPGDGCLDFLAIFKELKRHQYGGWLVIEAEQDPVVAPSFKMAQRGYQRIFNYAKKSKLI